MPMFGLNKAIHQLVMADSVRWYGHALIIEDGHVLRRDLSLRLKVNGGNGGLKRTWKKQIEEESIKVGLCQ